jgi:recombination protein RecA
MSQDANKKKALELAVAHIEKQFGQGSIMNFSKHASVKGIDVIQTGALTLDMALGIGGVPRGRVVEIFGPESSGKSTLALHIVANCQKNGGAAAYIDAEHALDPKYAKKIGVKIEDLMISQPDCGEDALNIAELLARSSAVDVIVIDSVAALVPKSELEGEIGDSFMGLQARMMSQALRKLTATLARSNTCAIFINQIREKIGMMFGNPETTTGGRALKFYSSVRIDLRRIGSVKNADGVDKGNRVRAKVVKNKMAPPFQTAEFDIMFADGINSIGALLDLAVDFSIVDKKGAWFSIGDRRLAQGRDACIEELKKEGALTKKIEELVLHKLKAEETKPEKAAPSAR